MALGVTPETSEEQYPWWLGLPPQVVGYSARGPIFAVCGGADDDDDGDKNDDDDDSDSGADSKSGDDSGDTGDKDGDKDKSDASGDDTKVSKSELDKVQERMRAADKRASDAEKKLREIEDKDKSELDVAKRDKAELEQSVQDLTAENRQLHLQIAILSDKDFGADKWHDATDVIERLSKDDTVTIDKDGAVGGVSAALKKLSKDKSYLLKTGTGKSGSDGDSGSSGDAGAGRSGGVGSKDKLSKDKLRERYPGLRR